MVCLMTTLNIQTKTTHYVGYRDLEDFITEHYGFIYEIVAAEECGNDESLSFYIGKNFDSDDAFIFAEMQQGIWHPHKTRMLLTKLAYDGLIPTGNYIVEVCW